MDNVPLQSEIIMGCHTMRDLKARGGGGGGEGGGGGHSGTEGGGALRISRKKGTFFKTSACPQFL